MLLENAKGSPWESYSKLKESKQKEQTPGKLEKLHLDTCGGDLTTNSPQTISSKPTEET